MTETMVETVARENAAADAAKLLAGKTATPADLARKPKPRPKPAAKSPAKRAPKAAPKVAPKPSAKINPADVQSPATVLQYAIAMRSALQSTPALKIANKDLLVIVGEQIKRSMRAGTDSSPAQLAKHAAVATTVTLTEFAQSSRKTARAKK